ncbi:MAG: AmmeMemoRadiSam system radical SAM enzyme [Candidatus Hodarchaeota archaeon]
MKETLVPKIKTSTDYIKKAIKKSKYFKNLRSKTVQCVLCPHECNIKRNNTGFCKVRKNIDGQLFNLNYGISTHMVVEPIETNAIFHYYPGEKALAVGSISCNLDCCFCQAWHYSKIKNMEDINWDYFTHYTPEQIVNKAKKLDLKIISWTFNDPMSWFEFVLDTAKLAKKDGIVSLFKSNHYINEIPLRDLAKYVDIFSISIKSIENDFYRKYCGGSLEPVLNAGKTLKSLNKHIEVCNLVIPTLNNDKEQFSKLLDWVKENLGTNTPLHFARFHPSHKLTYLPRTSLSDINLARKIAKSKGFEYVYSGNVFIDDGLNSYCVKCSNLLVSRRGERTIIKNKDLTLCDKCKTPHQIKFLKRKKDHDYIIKYAWKEDNWSIHIQVINYSNEMQILVIHNFFKEKQDNNVPIIERIKVVPNEKLRYTFNRINDKHNETDILFDKTVDVQIFENLDRAYYSLEKYNGYKQEK